PRGLDGGAAAVVPVVVERAAEEVASGLLLEEALQLNAESLEGIAQQDVAARAPVMLARQLIVEAGRVRAHAEDSGSRLGPDGGVGPAQQREYDLLPEPPAELRAVHRSPPRLTAPRHGPESRTADPCSWPAW